MSKYLFNEKNGRVLPWTPALAARSQMRTATDDEVKAALNAAKKDAAPAPAGGGFEADDGSGFEADDGSGNTDPPHIPPPVVPVPEGGLTLDAILAMTDKAEVEAAGRAVGLELDRRKALKTMQTDLIQYLGLGADE